MKSQSRRQGVIWSILLILFGVVMLVETFTDLSAWIWVIILAVAGLGAFGVYSMDRSAGGLLILTYVLWAVAGLVGLIELNILFDSFIALYVLGAIALPFLFVFLRDRNQWWGLIPAYVLLVIGVMVVLIDQEILTDLLIPAYIMFAIGIPFIAVYARDTKQWWALIPGGIMIFIGLSFLIAEAMIEYVGAAALIVLGIWQLVRQFIRKEPAAPEELSPPGPEVDQPPTE